MRKERQIVFAFRILHWIDGTPGRYTGSSDTKKIDFSASGFCGRLRILSPTGEPRGTAEEMGAALRDRKCLSHANGDGRLGVQDVGSSFV
jgi:hypothetical protein